MQNNQTESNKNEFWFISSLFQKSKRKPMNTLFKQAYKSNQVSLTELHIDEEKKCLVPENQTSRSVNFVEKFQPISPECFKHFVHKKYSNYSINKSTNNFVIDTEITCPTKLVNYTAPIIVRTECDYYSRIFSNFELGGRLISKEAMYISEYQVDLNKRISGKKAIDYPITEISEIKILPISKYIIYSVSNLNKNLVDKFYKFKMFSSLDNTNILYLSFTLDQEFSTLKYMSKNLFIFKYHQCDSAAKSKKVFQISISLPQALKEIKKFINCLLTFQEESGIELSLDLQVINTIKEKKLSANSDEIQPNLKNLSTIFSNNSIYSGSVYDSNFSEIVRIKHIKTLEYTPPKSSLHLDQQLELNNLEIEPILQLQPNNLEIKPINYNYSDLEIMYINDLVEIPVKIQCKIAHKLEEVVYSFQPKIIIEPEIIESTQEYNNIPDMKKYETMILDKEITQQPHTGEYYEGSYKVYAKSFSQFLEKSEQTLEDLIKQGYTEEKCSKVQDEMYEKLQYEVYGQYYDHNDFGN